MKCETYTNTTIVKLLVFKILYNDFAWNTMKATFHNFNYRRAYFQTLNGSQGLNFGPVRKNGPQCSFQHTVIYSFEPLQAVLKQYYHSIWRRPAGPGHIMEIFQASFAQLPKEEMIHVFRARWGLKLHFLLVGKQSKD